MYIFLLLILAIALFLLIPIRLSLFFSWEEKKLALTIGYLFIKKDLPIFKKQKHKPPLSLAMSVIKAFEIERLHLDFIYGSDDAMHSVLTVQAVRNTVSGLLMPITKKLQKTDKKLSIICNFCDKKLTLDLDCIISARVGNIIINVLKDTIFNKLLTKGKENVKTYTSNNGNNPAKNQRYG